MSFHDLPVDHVESAAKELEMISKGLEMISKELETWEELHEFSTDTRKSEERPSAPRNKNRESGCIAFRGGE